MTKEDYKFFKSQVLGELDIALEDVGIKKKERKEILKLEENHLNDLKMNLEEEK